MQILIKKAMACHSHFVVSRSIRTLQTQSRMSTFFFSFFKFFVRHGSSYRMSRSGVEGCKLLLCSTAERKPKRRCLNCSAQGGVGSSGDHVRAESTGGVGYALRSFQPRTTVQVRAAFADCRNFDARVVRYSIAAEDYRCVACPTGSSLFQRPVWGLS